MKYIRTKDGIYRYKLMDKNEYDFRVATGNIIPGKKIEEEVKIADTIEELCDEFVLINKKDKEHFVDVLSPDLYDYKNFTIYGAIWTDKGLIYVAKMNDKGELELL